MNKKISSKIISYLPQILALLFIAGFAVYAWTEPTQAPPGGNVATPLNAGPTGQSKEGGLILNTGNATTGLIVDKGESQFPSITIVGGTSLPTCDSSYRGKQYLLQSPSGTEDGLYVCKKKADGTYAWIALASPPAWVSFNKPGCQESCKVSWQTGGSASCCCVVDVTTCYSGVLVQVTLLPEGGRTVRIAGGIFGYKSDGVDLCCGQRYPDDGGRTGRWGQWAGMNFDATSIIR